MNETTKVAVMSHSESKTMLGFWIYLMTDCMLFASLFATYAVLHGGTFGGVTSREIFDMPFVLTETLILLTSSFACGLAVLAARQGKLRQVLGWFLLTFALGVAFLAMELSEFSKLVHEGNSWQASAFLSAFFTLVATHGLHITVGLIWIASMLVFVWKKGLTEHAVRKLVLLGMFWHFLDVVWIFIFTMVYLMGAI
jgi:cytochrome o ubiquinol oxidase subunit 3